MKIKYNPLKGLRIEPFTLQTLKDKLKPLSENEQTTTLQDSDKKCIKRSKFVGVRGRYDLKKLSVEVEFVNEEKISD